MKKVEILVKYVIEFEKEVSEDDVIEIGETLCALADDCGDELCDYSISDEVYDKLIDAKKEPSSFKVKGLHEDFVLPVYED